MNSTHDIGPISQQYAAAATVPLIKSPSLWLPKPVELPNDIHPLPEDITAYFVYPFTLEEHVLGLRPSPHEAIAQRRARNAAILHQREQEEEQKEREALHRVAPGYNPSAVLVPTSASTSTPKDLMGGSGTPIGTNTVQADTYSSNSMAGIGASTEGGGDPMDELVSKLEEMENKR